MSYKEMLHNIMKKISRITNLFSKEKQKIDFHTGTIFSYFQLATFKLFFPTWDGWDNNDNVNLSNLQHLRWRSRLLLKYVCT